jgi:transposase-like protein
MESKIATPKSLQEAIILFSDKLVCHNYMVSKRFPNGVACPHCGDIAVGFVQTRLIWNCKGCKKQFSVKVGTVLEESPLPLSTWLPAFWLIANAKNGISSCELGRALNVTQKTAWFMLHRIRLVMQQGTFEKLAGTIEADETFIGGLEKNKHKGKKLNRGRGGVGKAIVMGLLERAPESGSKVKVALVPDTSKDTLQTRIRDSVAVGSVVHTDAHAGYHGLGAAYAHAFVDHAVEYVRDTVVHTNSLENYWSLLKRTLRGTYVSCDVEHLPKYLDEQTFRFNHRKDNDAGRFETAIGSVNGKRLTYKKLTER